MAKAESHSLQRGKACLRCRKRKMRCDGIRPSCQQCIKASKGDCCEYDDGKSKTRTQIMRETIQKLEARVKELEDPEYVAPLPTLALPTESEHHQRSLSSSSSSSASFPGSPSSFAHSPHTSDTTNSPPESWLHLPIPSPSPSLSGDYFEPPIELNQMLLDIFTPHRHQCALDLHMGRLRESIFLPTSEQRHPSLMNAIYLWACYVSRPEALCQHESHYLNLAQEAINDGLKSEDRLLDIIQASGLLAMYFIANGRFLEGSYHAGAAASMVVQFGLHSPFRAVDAMTTVPSTAFQLPPAKDAVEQGERNALFWQCFNLDRCYSVILRKPAVIPDSLGSYDSINIPWPKSFTEYELMDSADKLTDFQTVGCFLAGGLANAYAPNALRAQASALFHYAHQLSLSLDMQITPPASPLPLEAVQSTSLVIMQYISTLPPLDSLSLTASTSFPEDKYIYVTCHVLARCAIIYLHRPFAQDDAPCYNKCLDAAREVVSVIRCLCDADFRFLEPVLAACWTLVAEVLVRELDSIDASWPLLSNADVRSEIGIVLYALGGLQARFACAGVAIERIQKRLADV